MDSCAPSSASRIISALMSSRGLVGEAARTGVSPPRRRRHLLRTWGLLVVGSSPLRRLVVEDDCARLPCPDLLELEGDGFVAVVVGVDRVRDEPDRLTELVVLEALEIAVHQVRLRRVPAAVEVDDRRDEAVAQRRPSLTTVKCGGVPVVANALGTRGAFREAGSALDRRAQRERAAVLALDRLEMRLTVIEDEVVDDRKLLPWGQSGTKSPPSSPTPARKRPVSEVGHEFGDGRRELDRHVALDAVGPPPRSGGPPHRAPWRGTMRSSSSRRDGVGAQAAGEQRRDPDACRGNRGDRRTGALRAWPCRCRRRRRRPRGVALGGAGVVDAPAQWRQTQPPSPSCSPRCAGSHAAATTRSGWG